MHETVDERALVGTLAMDEVRPAVQNGYQLIEVFEVCQYEVSQYYPKTGEGGLFAEYINTILKLKAEARGYPDWVQTPEDEYCYTENFYSRESIRLDTDSLRPKATKHGLVKLCLNCIWGKLTELNNRTNTN